MRITTILGSCKLVYMFIVDIFMEIRVKILNIDYDITILLCYIIIIHHIRVNPIIHKSWFHSFFYAEILQILLFINSGSIDSFMARYYTQLPAPSSN